MENSSRERSRWVSAALRLAGAVIAAVTIAVVVTVGMLSLGQVSAPSWMKRLAEDRITSITGGRTAELAGIGLSFDLAGFSPLVTIEHAELTDLSDLSTLRMSGIQITLDTWEALAGTLQVRSVAVDSTRVSAELNVASAEKLLSAGGGGIPLSSLLSPLGAFRDGAVAALDGLEFSSVEALLRVAETGRTVRLADGGIEVVRGSAGLEGSGRFAWQLTETEEALVTATISAPQDGGPLDIGIEINGVRPADLETFASLPDRLAERSRPILVRLLMQTDHQGLFHDVEWEIAASGIQNAAETPDVGFRLHIFSASGSYHLPSNRLTVHRFQFDSSAGSAVGGGYADLYPGADGAVFAAGRMEFRDARTDSWRWLPSPVQGAAGVADFRIDLRTLDFEVVQLTMRSEGMVLEAQGRAQHDGGGWRAAADIGLAAFSHDALTAFWPGSAAGAKNWVAARLHAGRGYAANVGLRAVPGENTVVSGNFQFSDLGLEFIDAFPPLASASGYGVFDSDSLAVRFESGVVNSGHGGPVDIAGTEFKLEALSDANPSAAVDVSLAGSAESLLHLLNQPPLKLLAGADLLPDIARGDVTASGRFQFPLQKGLTAQDIRFTVFAEARSVSSRPFEGHRFESELVRIRADNEGVHVAADGQYRGIPISGEWSRAYTSGVRGSPITGTVQLSSEGLEELGIPGSAGAVKGEQPADFFLTFFPDRRPEFGISADAANLAISIPGLPVEKPIGEPAQLVLEGRLGEPVELHRISLSGENYQVEGSVEFSPNGEVSKAVLSDIKFGRWLDVSAVYDVASVYSAMITGGTVDLNTAPVSRLASRQRDMLKGPVQVRLDEVRLSPGTVLNAVRGTLFVDSVDKDIRGEFTAALNGRADVRVSVNLGSGGSSMRFQSADAGALLRAAGVLENMHGGGIVVDARPETVGAQVNLRLKITDVRARQMPALGELLSLASIIGLAEQLNGDGILFSEVQAEIVTDGERVEITRAFASGPSLGMTVEGVFDRKEGNMDFKGVITPLNVANEILIMTPLRALGLGKGDGIGAVSYFIRGPAENPTAGVNPLSVFTPGIFKNLFQ